MQAATSASRARCSAISASWKDFANFVYLSQIQQGLAIATAVDYWRSLKPIAWARSIGSSTIPGRSPPGRAWTMAPGRRCTTWRGASSSRSTSSPFRAGRHVGHVLHGQRHPGRSDRRHEPLCRHPRLQRLLIRTRVGHLFARSGDGADARRDGDPGRRVARLSFIALKRYERRGPPGASTL